LARQRSEYTGKKRENFQIKGALVRRTQETCPGGKAVGREKTRNKIRGGRGGGENRKS